VEPILEACGLRGHFEVAVFGEDVTRHKPDPEPYRKAAGLLGISRALVVEDSEAGVASGRAAGFDVLRIPDPHEMAALVRRRLSL
jgi:HAD superfamily hydrolase (TIGR01509 family)